MCDPAPNSPFCFFPSEQSIDEAGGEGVAAADPVQYLEWPLWNVNNLALMQGDGSPVIAVAVCAVRSVVAISFRLG